MGTRAPTLRIRGRATEIAVLAEALDRVASGGPAVVLIEGEAGIGKTRLLDETLQDALGRGMQVAAGRAEELERTRPFGLVSGAFGCARSSPDPRRAAIAELLAAGGGGERGPITVTSDPGLRFRAVDAFTDLAEELALSGPLVIGVDDLQWADPSSLLTLGALSRRLAYLPVALIGCLRPSPGGPELDRLAGALAAADARHLIVRGLAKDAVTELVAEASPPARGLLRSPRRNRFLSVRVPEGASRPLASGRGGGDHAAAIAAADHRAPYQLPARRHPANAADRLDPWNQLHPH